MVQGDSSSESEEDERQKKDEDTGGEEGDEKNQLEKDSQHLSQQIPAVASQPRMPGEAGFSLHSIPLAIESNLRDKSGCDRRGTPRQRPQLCFPAAVPHGSPSIQPSTSPAI